MDEILDIVKSSLSEPEPLVNGVDATTEQLTFTSTATPLLRDPSLSLAAASTAVTAVTASWDDMDAEAIIDDIEFVDHGEGAGIEGDLDVDEE